MKKKLVRIHIGEYYASARPVVINTILGSCVSVCLFDPALRAGGMNHILLPGEADLSTFDLPARFGINAMELLINALMKEGGDRKRFVAKLFGGADIIPGISGEFRIGPRIISFVKEFLLNERIRVLNSDLGGNRTRKIYFHTDTGSVFVKRLKGKPFPRLFLEEKRKLEKIRKEAEQDLDVLFFKP